MKETAFFFNWNSNIRAGLGTTSTNGTIMSGMHMRDLRSLHVKLIAKNMGGLLTSPWRIEESRNLSACGSSDGSRGLFVTAAVGR